MRSLPIPPQAPTGVLGALLLAGCTPGAAAPVPPALGPLDRVAVEVVARVNEPGTPAAWTAEARVSTGPTASPPRSQGETCAPLSPTAPPGAGPRIDALRITRPDSVALRWDPARALWASAGPHQVVDAAWGVGDVTIEVADERIDAEGAVRFGGLPRVLGVEREADGAVRIQWDARTVDDVELRVVGPAGLVRCTADGSTTTLPWWAVPALDGEVILRSTRQRTAELPNGVLLQVDAVIERVIPLDGPREQAAEPPPPPPSLPPTRGLRRSSRPPRPTFG